MACCDYVCRKCGNLEVENGTPKVCLKCGAKDSFDRVGFDEENIRGEEDEDEEE